MAKSCGSTSVACPICDKTIGRRADLARHLRTHASNKEELMHACPYLECKYKTLQRSNLATHLNVHSREKPHRCPVDGCEFASSDPGSLTRHRKEVHGYEPKANPRNNKSGATRKEARQKRKISPYAKSGSSSSTSSGSVSPLNPTLDTYESPRPQLPLLVEQGSLPSLSPTDGPTGRGTKHNEAAYDTELIGQLPQGNNWCSTSDAQPGTSRTSASGLFVAPAAPRVECPFDQENLCATGQPARPVARSTTSELNDAALDDFIGRFENWDPVAASAPIAAFLPPPVAEHTVGSAPLPVPYTTDLLTASIQYTNDNVSVASCDPFSALVVQRGLNNASARSLMLPAPGVPYMTDLLAPVPNTWFDNSYFFAAPNTSVYSQGLGQSYFFPASAATNVFDTQGLYLH